MNVPTIGNLIKPEEFGKRDAIHVAIAPVELNVDCIPGQKVYLLNQMNDLGYHLVTNVGEQIVGVIDPYLSEERILKGSYVWLFLYPNSITSLRHVWTHDLFSRI